ncbi:hypothetical protein L1987_46874 [Smallanthus sonchifolius]|uniref:Uncharacterized protein n=1 Tax=Smallanthus sonchifolius TaxID=185202 RepID=A0ACB9G1Z4_9ASTR|nr:hypothetical protein L1987_46874 [Smallanthus sonchifolius]
MQPSFVFSGEGDEDRRGGRGSHVTEFERRGGGVGGCGGETRSFGVFPAAAPDGDVAESAAVGLVPAAGLAEMTWLGEVVVAEFGVGGVATWAWKVFGSETPATLAAPPASALGK